MSGATQASSMYMFYTLFAIAQLDLHRHEGSNITPKLSKLEVTVGSEKYTRPGDQWTPFRRAA